DNSTSSESEDEDDTWNTVDDDDAKTTRAGRLYVLNFGLWVKGNARIFQTEFDPSYDEKQRFETTAMKVQGQLRDINQTLPYDLRATTSGKTFMDGVTSQRSNTSTRLRKAAGAAIFDCKSTDLLSTSVRLKKFRDEIGWYVEEGSSGGYSSLDVPILHRNWTGKYDIKTCFLNPVLMRAIWALSADTCLRNRGDKTNIDYDELYDQYLEILITGLREKRRSIINVFKEWDQIIFPHSESGHAG
ncbi:hypothetical protein K438DRAFT_1450785, partial [Mycena galopus ATCC 62051]